MNLMISKYQTCIETRVVTARKRYHDLSFVLDNLVVGNTVLAQQARRDQAHLVAQEGGSLLLQLREQAVR